MYGRTTQTEKVEEKTKKTNDANNIHISATFAFTRICKPHPRPPQHTHTSFPHSGYSGDVRVIRVIRVMCGVMCGVIFGVDHSFFHLADLLGIVHGIPAHTLRQAQFDVTSSAPEGQGSGDGEVIRSE